jgi:hypothetical protein
MPLPASSRTPRCRTASRRSSSVRIRPAGTGQGPAERSVDQANVVRQINERLNPVINQVMTQKGANLAVDVGATRSWRRY